MDLPASPIDRKIEQFYSYVAAVDISLESKLCIRFSSKVMSHSSLIVYSHSTRTLLERASLDPESCFTIDLQ